MSEIEMSELEVWIGKNVMAARPKIEARALDASETGMALWETDLITRGAVRDFCQKHPEYHYKECEVWPCYPTSREDALAVLEKCSEKAVGREIAIRKESNGYFVGLCDWFYEELVLESSAETLPLAICLFAKKLFSENAPQQVAAS